METQRAITLTQEETFEYLAELKEKIGRITTSDDLPGMMHRQLYDIINAEENFLNSYHSEPMIAVAPNGLPSTDTLKADLEAMCKLEEFKEIAEKYQPNSTENKKEGPTYSTITEKEWNQQKDNHKKLTEKTRFRISEQEGRLELTLTNELYIKGYDEYSQKYPILTREGITKYRIEFGWLIQESKEQYKAVNNSLATKNKDTPNLLTRINSELTEYKKERDKNMKVGAIDNTERRIKKKLLELAFATEFPDKKISFSYRDKYTFDCFWLICCTVYLKEPSAYFFKDKIAKCQVRYVVPDHYSCDLYSNGRYIEQLDKVVLKYRELLSENKIELDVQYYRHT